MKLLYESAQHDVAMGKKMRERYHRWYEHIIRKRLKGEPKQRWFDTPDHNLRVSWLHPKQDYNRSGESYSEERTRKGVALKVIMA